MRWRYTFFRFFSRVFGVKSVGSSAIKIHFPSICGWVIHECRIESTFCYSPIHLWMDYPKPGKSPQDLRQLRSIPRVNGDYPKIRGIFPLIFLGESKSYVSHLTIPFFCILRFYFTILTMSSTHNIGLPNRKTIWPFLLVTSSCDPYPVSCNNRFYVYTCVFLLPYAYRRGSSRDSHQSTHIPWR